MNSIKSEILADIRSSNQSIKVAVSWFTDPQIIDELITQSIKGKKVEVIVSGDNWNIIEFERFDILQRNGGMVNKKGAKEFNQPGFMHTKFMVIDEKIAREGSYNFTKNAQYQDNHFNKTSNASILLEQFKAILANSVDFFEDVVNPKEIRDNLSILENEGAIPEEKLQRLAELKLKKAEEKLILQEKQIRDAEDAREIAVQEAVKLEAAKAKIIAEQRAKDGQAQYEQKSEGKATRVPPTSYGS
jgi:phosphatidylserine/phosphatidylglycerophosphate/cardiolipin synthase-like enzyme